MCGFFKKLIHVGFVSLFVSSVAIADDIDIFGGEVPFDSNVLFIMDLSGSMDYSLFADRVALPFEQSRLDVLRGAFQDIINDDKYKHVNVGLSVFSGGFQDPRGGSVGHGISYPIAPLIGKKAQKILSKRGFKHSSTSSYMPDAGSANTREYLTRLSSDRSIWDALYGTPIVDALYEGVRYFHGKTVDLGRFPPTDVRSAHPSTYKGSGAGSKYISPVKTECQNNGIILLTDGKPTVNFSKNSVKSLLGVSSCAINDYNFDGQDDFSVYTSRAGECGVELARYMASTDIKPKLKGKQSISLFTIGLALSTVGSQSTASYLDELAREGGGVSFLANDRASLVDAFAQAVAKIDKRARSFSAPTYTVDTSSMLTHSDSVYVPVFSRNTEPYWPGNLKKYKLKGGRLYGKGDKEATDNNGKLKDDVGDLWSKTSTSVNATISGGAANNLDPSTRKVFTDDGGSLVRISTATAGQLGVNNADKSKLIKFIRGFKSGGTPRFHMGEIIHSKPVQLMTGAAGSKKSVVFAGTNEGFLHAIDSETGKELFAYMPQELLKNIKPQYNKTSLDHHLYGVDGAISLHKSKTKVSIYFGLRRGGKAYYGLDVTDPKNPSLKWKFTHERLGYSWSQPTIAKLRYNGADAKDVLIVGGGYVDDNHIDSNTPDTDKNSNNVAAAVFIIDAETGTLIKEISSGLALEYAVPSKIKAIDMDRDGSVDRLYFTDTGGHVLRVDLDPDKDNNIDDYKLTTLASLGGTPAQRKFFSEPDVAMFKRGGRVFISVSVGSGQRPNPLDVSVQNYFYVLFDENIFNTPVSSQNISPSDLFNAPLTSSQNLLAELAKLGGKRGWKIALNKSGAAGEKSLSSSITFQNKVMFTTLGVTTVNTPTNDGSTCGSTSNVQSNLYVLDLLSGKAALDLNKDGSVNDSNDSVIKVGTGEIPDTPQIVRGGFQSSKGKKCTNTDCMRPFEIHSGNGPSIANTTTLALTPIPLSQTLPRVYWLEQDQ